MKTAYIFAAFIAVGLIIATVASVAGTIQPPFPPVTNGHNTISVQGESSREFDPEEVELFFSVETKATTAEHAQKKNAEKMELVKKELRNAGVYSGDMELTNFNVRPNYDWSKGDKKITGYTASHGIKVTSTDIDSSGKLLDTAVSAGANRVDYISFKLSDETAKKMNTKLTKEASQNAREKAEAIAEGLGLRIVGIRSVNDQSYNYRPHRYDNVMFVAAASGQEVNYAPETDISPRDVNVNARVSVVFEMA